MIDPRISALSDRVQAITAARGQAQQASHDVTAALGRFRPRAHATETATTSTGQAQP